MISILDMLSVPKRLSIKSAPKMLLEALKVGDFLIGEIVLKLILFVPFDGTKVGRT